MVNKGTHTVIVIVIVIVIVAPILPSHKEWPFVVNIVPSRANGLDKERHINLKQLRAVDVSRIGNKQGNIERQYLKKIKSALQIIFGSELYY